MGQVVNGLSPLSWTAEIRKKPEETENAIRLVSYIACGCINYLGSTTPLLTNLTTRLLTHADYISSYQMMPSLDYWYKGEYRNDSPLCVSIQAVFTSVTAGCVALLLDDLKFIDIGKIAAKLGNEFAVLKPLATLTSTVVIHGQLAVAFALLTVWDVNEMMNPENSCEKNIKLGIDLVKNVSQVALRVLFVMGSTTTSPAIIALGVTAYGLSLVSFIYGVVNRGKIEKVVAKSDEPLPTGNDIPLDFLSRTATQFEGWDAVTKFSAGIFEGYKLVFGPLNTSFALLSDNLGDILSFNKATKLFDNVQKLINSSNLTERVGCVFTTAVSLFDFATFYWSISDLGKPGNIFKSTKNVFFLLSLYNGTIRETKKLDASYRKMAEAQGHKTKWSARPQINNLPELRNYYYNRLYDNPNLPNERFEKVQKWHNQIARIDAGDMGQAQIDVFNSNREKKIRIWDSLETYFINFVEDTNKARAGSFGKMVSIGFELGKIALEVTAISAVIIPGIGVNFAVLYWTKAAVTITNLALGCNGIDGFAHKQYVVDEHKKTMNFLNEEKYRNFIVV